MENLLQEVMQYVNDRQFIQVRKLLEGLNPTDIAHLICQLDEKDALRIFRILPKDVAGEAFAYMESETQKQLILGFSDAEIKSVINELWLDDTVDIIEEMPANVVARILQNTTPAVRQQINELLKYPEHTAGSIMTVEYVSLNKELTVDEAFAKIRREGINKETVYTCYVTEKRRLIGTVSIKDLLLAKGDQIVSEIMETSFVLIDAYEDKEVVAQTFSKYDMVALPVVDKERRIVGIVTVDDALDVLQSEATEDIVKMTAIIPTDKPYLKTGVLSIWLSRIPWLLLLMVSATFTGGIINSFEEALVAFPLLISFIPMLMGTAGNAGGQSSVTIIRSMAIGEITIRDTVKVIWKEIRVSVLCGVALAIAGFLKIILIDNLLLNSGVSTIEAFVVSLTLIVTVVIAKVVGCVLPIVAKRLGLDPAVMASPFITTIVDAVSLLVYFEIAGMIMSL